jgi:hypothetical protein
MQTCVVDGKTYQEGDIFYPNTENKLLCQCSEGYEGKKAYSVI